MEVEVTLASREEVPLCQEVRRQVFVEEQGIPAALEADAHDAEASHFLARAGGLPVAAGRLRIQGDRVKFERIATLKAYRGRGIGRMLMARMEEHCRRELPRHLPSMSAQKSAVSFYLGIGWEPEGGEFQEAGIPHQVLVRRPSR
jgi:predicted GNAT family N-acyltransferase